jgi:putative oxidoreductase
MARDARSLLFGTSSAGPAADVGLLLFRVWAGLALAFLHGIGKVPPQEGFVGRVGQLFPVGPAEAWAWAAASAEFLAALLLVLGLLARPAAALVALHFTLVVVVAHAGDPLAERELPLFFLFSGLLFLFVGAGRYSLDALISRRMRAAPPVEEVARHGPDHARGPVEAAPRRKGGDGWRRERTTRTREGRSG